MRVLTSRFSWSLLVCLLLNLPVFAAPLQKHAAVQKPGILRGKALFQDHCSVCHGIDGGGGRGPNLHTPKLKHAVDEKGVRMVIEDGIPPAMPDAWYLSDQEIADVARYVKSLGSIPPEKLPGNAKTGAAVYAQSGCAMCHVLQGKGNAFGPDLTEVGARRGATQLRDTLRKPSQNIPQEFLLVQATTESGDEVRGVRLNEDSFTIQLRDMAGRIYSLRKSDLKELKKLRGETPMPSYQSLPSGEMDNLVAFLAAQRGEQ